MGNCCSAENTKGSTKAGSRLPERALMPLAANFVNENININVEEKYETVRLIGVGSMGLVSAVKKKGSADGKLYALKTLRMGRAVQSYIRELEREILIVRNLDHPNIVKAFDVFREQRKIHLVMELCEGGDLYKRQPYTEKEAASIMRKVLNAVGYLHSNGIVHRDLKFDNIMFETQHPDSEPKIIDFGLSAKYSPKRGPLRAQVGTFTTMAPEVFQGEYTISADMWSLGVIAFMLLSGQEPFKAKTQLRLISQVCNARYDFNDDGWKGISKQARDFCSSLLEKDVQKRLDVGQAKAHPWLDKSFQASLKATSPPQNLLSAVNSPQLKKIAMLLIAHHTPANEIMELRKEFDKYDENNSGVVSREEFESVLRQQGNCTKEKIDEIFASSDVYKNGVISYTEFVAAALMERGNIEEERIADAFDRIDSDSTGFISLENLKDLLGRDFTEEKAKQFIDEIDTTRDGQVSYEEFLVAFRKENDSLWGVAIDLPNGE